MTKPRIVTPDSLVCPKNGGASVPHNNASCCRSFLHPVRSHPVTPLQSLCYQALTKAGTVIAYWNASFPQ
jgi:hypothetical protein